MQYDMAANLRVLLPKAVEWAKERAAAVEASGVPLTPNRIVIARRVGVQRPESIRLAIVRCMPLPEDAMLREAALATGMLGAGTMGLTLGHSILICHGYDSAELMAHECRHVYQYEQYGSIESFLPVYLQQLLQCGYFSAPLEVDARNHERYYA